jgi:uncharacterized protein (DUF488 family)
MAEAVLQEILTVGHSNHSVEDFIALLKNHSVQVVADVRSSPYSQRHPQFNRGTVEAHLRDAAIDYTFLGDELGARPAGQDCYRDGRVSFHELECSARFQEGLRKLMQIAQFRRVALLCAERDPLECHRMILVSHALSRKGIPVSHILADGTVESNEAAERRLVSRLDIQGGLFEPPQTPAELIERAYEEQAQKIAYSPEPLHDISATGGSR